MKAIVAVDNEWGIGKEGKLLCHISGDLRHFKDVTTGKTIVMGRKTLESFPGGKPLPNRTNIVLSRSNDYMKEGVQVVHDVSELTDVLSDVPDEEVFVVGGAEIYGLLLPACNEVYVTRIFDTFGADRFFKDLDADPAFEVAMSSGDFIENGIKYRFMTYIRSGEDA